MLASSMVINIHLKPIANGFLVTRSSAVKEAWGSLECCEELVSTCNQTHTNVLSQNRTHPRPDTGSQPSAAKKPVLSQFGLDPLVTSLNTSVWLYCSQVSQAGSRLGRNNFRQLTRISWINPTVLLLAASRCSFTSVKTAPHTGEDKLVPPTVYQPPSVYKTK